MNNRISKVVVKSLEVTSSVSSDGFSTKTRYVIMANNGVIFGEGTYIGQLPTPLQEKIHGVLKEVNTFLNGEFIGEAKEEDKNEASKPEQLAGTTGRFSPSKGILD